MERQMESRVKHVPLRKPLEGRLQTGVALLFESRFLDHDLSCERLYNGGIRYKPADLLK